MIHGGRGPPPQSVRSLSEDASKTLVQAFVSCRLDYCSLCVLRHLWRTDEPVTVGSERRRPSGDWYSTFRPHKRRCSVRQLHWLYR